jgi:hypothetical protein
MTRATNAEFEAWKAECIANPAKLDSLPRSVAQMWRKQWGINGTTVSKTLSTRILAKGVGFSLELNEQSTIEQVIDFAFQLQMMRSAETINDEIWMMGAQSIKEWLLDHDMTWEAFLANMKEQVSQ